MYLLDRALPTIHLLIIRPIWEMLSTILTLSLLSHCTNPQRMHPKKKENCCPTKWTNKKIREMVIGIKRQRSVRTNKPYSWTDDNRWRHAHMQQEEQHKHNLAEQFRPWWSRRISRWGTSHLVGATVANCRSRRLGRGSRQRGSRHTQSSRRRQCPSPIWGGVGERLGEERRDFHGWVRIRRRRPVERGGDRTSGRKGLASARGRRCEEIGAAARGKRLGHRVQEKVVRFLAARARCAREGVGPWEERSTLDRWSERMSEIIC